MQVAQVAQVAQVHRMCRWPFPSFRMIGIRFSGCSRAKGSEGPKGSEGSEGFPNVPLAVPVISTDRICAV